MRWRSPWICIPNSGKNTLGYSNFSYSNFQLFEAISVPLGANCILKHPQLFEFLLLGDRQVRTLILRLKHFFSSKNQVSIFMAIYTLQTISSKVQHFPRSRELNQTGDPKVLAISKVSSFPCHFYYASKIVTSLT